MKKGHTYIKKLSETKKRDVVASYLAGDSLRTIAARFGVDHTSVASILDVRGVPRRTYSEANRSSMLNEAAFDVLTEESAYWAGFMMADGNISVREYSTYVTLGLAEADRDHVAAFRTFLGSTHTIDVQANENGY